MTPGFDRDRHLEAAIDRTDAWDLIIIGGGASGVGAALDAATRGLSVLLLEGTDFGKGTSSRSTKLIHGGVVPSSRSQNGNRRLRFFRNKQHYLQMVSLEGFRTSMANSTIHAC